MSSLQSLTQLAAGNLRAEMARHSKSGADLASVLKVSQSSASRRMTGETALSLDDLEEIAAWLGIPLSRLLGSDTSAVETTPGDLIARAEQRMEEAA